MSASARFCTFCGAAIVKEIGPAVVLRQCPNCHSLSFGLPGEWLQQREEHHITLEIPSLPDEPDHQIEIVIRSLSAVTRHWPELAPSALTASEVAFLAGQAGNGKGDG